MARNEDYIETYGVEIVHMVRDGLSRFATIDTKAEGLRDLDQVDYIRHMFEEIASKMGPDVRIKFTRKIVFYCHSRHCHSPIGHKTIPLKIESFRHETIPLSYEKETMIELKTEQYRCEICGHETRYSIQDPILSVY